MKYKLIATDLDGTFLSHDSNEKISSGYALKKLKENKIKIVVCTGRGYIGSKLIIDKYPFDYLVGCNGAIVYDINNKKVIFEKTIPLNIAKQLVSILQELEVDWSAEGKNELIFSHNSHTHPYTKNPDYAFKFSNEIHDKPFKFMILNRKSYDDIIKKIDSEFPNIFSFFKMDMTLEITMLNINKYTGLKKILDLLKIENKNILALGDSGNDIQLLENSVNSVAMGNAPQYLKKICKYIADDINNDGWYKIMIELGII